MLDAAFDATVGNDPEAAMLAFYCAIARQCFLNEYVFAETEEDTAQTAALRDRIDFALAAQQQIPSVARECPRDAETNAAGPAGYQCRAR